MYANPNVIAICRTAITLGCFIAIVKIVKPITKG